MTFYKPLLAAACAMMLSACHLPKRPVTETEALELAKKIQTSIELQDRSVLDSLLDDRLFAAKVVKDIRQEFNLSIAQRARQSILQVKLGSIVLPTIREGGDYALVRHYEKDGCQHLLFRLTAAGGDINYHDFELGRGQRGVRADDLYIYANGSLLTKAFEDSAMEQELRAKMTDDDRTNDDAYRESSSFLRGGNPEEAYSLYLQASDKARKQQKFQKLHLKIAMKLGDSAVRAAFEEYKTNFPKDPFVWLDLFKYNAFSATSQPEKNAQAALDALNGFDRLLPDDPFLDYYRGAIYKTLKQPEKSREALRRIHTAFPRLGGPVVQLMDNYVQANQPDSAAMLVLEAIRIRNITPSQLDNIKKIYPSIVPYLKSGLVAPPSKREVIPPSGS